MFFEMRFDLGTLDSGEQSLPFGLLVFQTRKKKNANLFISNYVCLKFSVFDKTNITLNISTDF